ncbi:MAG: HgcAB-like fusion protein [Candidatus Aminicenantaceae bacterium]
MKLFGYVVINIAETLLRFLPFPCKTGLRVIGSPDKNSPVFLTCNYHLTVERVKRALKGMNAYLLVANSRGINVWCASVGGHFTVHDVISVLRTSGIEQLVNHKKVILPQLAAPGVETTVITKKTGWHIIWGPVYARDIPHFVKNNLKKDQKMREVEFPSKQRIEMAVAWAFPISLISGILVLLFVPEILLPLVILVWGLAFALFIFFPIYSSWLAPDRGSTGLMFMLWGISISALLVYSIATANFSWKFFIQWSVISFIVIFILSVDLNGSIPVLKSGFIEEKQFKVMIDESRCKGAGLCVYVCPRNCFRCDRLKKVPVLVNQERCIHCGACIVQCPFDALFFESPEGGRIGPETVRKFKLNLLGKRLSKKVRYS